MEIGATTRGRGAGVAASLRRVTGIDHPGLSRHTSALMDGPALWWEYGLLPLLGVVTYREVVRPNLCVAPLPSSLTCIQVNNFRLTHLSGVARTLRHGILWAALGEPKASQYCVNQP